MGNSAKNLPHSNQARKIHTSRFGEIEIDDGKLITMTSPFLGFPNDHHFVLLPHGPKALFFWLQSVETPTLAFVIISPDYMIKQYQPEMSPAVKKELQIAQKQDMELMVILTIPPGKPQEMTANLLGPIVLNPAKRLAKQVILDPYVYDPCWPVPLQ